MELAAAQSGKAKKAWLLPTVCYAVACLALLPFFKEIIDTDDVVYLEMARRLATGDWFYFINGLWNPLNPAIGAALLPTGIPELILFKLLNIVFGCLLMPLMLVLLKRAEVPEKSRQTALLCLIPFFVYATYHELCADWLQMLFLCGYLCVLYAPKYKTSLRYALVCGLIGGLAYYAKYYSLQWFLLHFTLSNFAAFCFRKEEKDWRQFFRFTAVGAVVAIVLVVPWVLLLHHRYGFWKLNYGGAINLAWSMDAASIFATGQTVLPPTLPGGMSWFEDPYPLQKAWLTPLSSGHLFLKQIGRSGLAFGGLILWLTAFSVLLPPAIFLGIKRFFSKTKQLALVYQRALLVTLTMPLGYLIFHFEARYIWLIYLVGFVAIFKMIQENARLTSTKKWLLIATFWLLPGYEISRSFTRHDEVTGYAKSLVTAGLSGKSFITNAQHHHEKQLSWLAQMPIYEHNNKLADTAVNMQLARDFKVDFYLEFPAYEPYFTKNEMAGMERLPVSIKGINVWQLARKTK